MGLLCPVANKDCASFHFYFAFSDVSFPPFCACCANVRATYGGEYVGPGIEVSSGSALGAMIPVFVF